MRSRFWLVPKLLALGCTVVALVTSLLLAISPSMATSYPNVIRISLSASGSQLPTNSDGGAISGDGSTVAFVTASAAVGTDTNTFNDIYVRTIADNSIERVSVRSDGSSFPGMAIEPSLSLDGRLVAFAAQENFGTGMRFAVFVRDLDLQKTTMLSVGIGGAAPNFDSREPAISADGRFVSFKSEARNLVEGGYERRHGYLCGEYPSGKSKSFSG